MREHQPHPPVLGNGMRKLVIGGLFNEIQKYNVIAMGGIKDSWPRHRGALKGTVILIRHASHRDVEHDGIPRLIIGQDILRGGPPILPLHVFEVMLIVGSRSLIGEDNE